MSNNFPIYNISASQINPSNSLRSYINFVNSIPVLTKQEEILLIKKYQEKNDQKSLYKVILSNLRYVILIARKYNSFQFQLADLIQEGNIGLLKAIKKFNPLKNVKLITFAEIWIKSEIYQFIMKNLHKVRIGTNKDQSKLFFNLRKEKARLRSENSNPEEINKEIAKLLNVKESNVRKMDNLLYSNDISIENIESEQVLISNEKFNQLYQQQKYNNPITRNEDDNIKEYIQKEFYKAFNNLSTREQDIIRNRKLKSKKVTLKDLSNKYNISIERIRQIESLALKKLKESLAYLKKFNIS